MNFKLYFNRVDPHELVAEVQAASLEKVAANLNCDIVCVMPDGVELKPRWSLGELEGNRLVITEASVIKNDEDLRARLRSLGYTLQEKRYCTLFHDANGCWDHTPLDFPVDTIDEAMREGYAGLLGREDEWWFEVVDLISETGDPDPVASGGFIPACVTENGAVTAWELLV